jgi:hypothetical protein
MSYNEYSNIIVICTIGIPAGKAFFTHPPAPSLIQKGRGERICMACIINKNID